MAVVPQTIAVPMACALFLAAARKSAKPMASATQTASAARANVPVRNAAVLAAKSKQLLSLLFSGLFYCTHPRRPTKSFTGRGGNTAEINYV